VSAPDRPLRIEIPRWIQLVGLPLLLVLAWVVVSATGHVVFVFAVAALLALLLDPLARALQRLHLPRGLSVAVVYLSFLAALGLVIFAVATSVAGQTTTAATRLNGYFTHPRAGTGQTSADRDVDRLQHWLN
jgi:predicted PurR-regulated permease PerM